MRSGITRIVLTGGPCAGKTTALARIVDCFTSRGYKVYTQPEAATLFHHAGVDFRTSDQALFRESERQLLKFQISLEDNLYRIAEASKKPVLIIFDRGVMDNAAYMHVQLWQELVLESGSDEVGLRDMRYEAVLHMCTAAKGAEAYYNYDNNSRTESIDEAVRIDNLLIEAWSGHPHLRVIDNSTGFEGKIQRVLAEISAVLGIPEPIECERKFLVDMTDEVVGGNETEISQIYLCSEDGLERRIRKRGNGSNFIYYQTTKRILGPGKRIEVERQISSEEFAELKRSADPGLQTIRKIRRCFVYGNRYFELDTFIEPELPHCLLEIEGAGMDENISFPPFLKVLEEVTCNREYYNRNIAEKGGLQLLQSVSN